MEKTLLLNDGSFSLWKEQGIPLEAIEFLNNISWGNEGAIYEHKNTKEHFTQISNPYLISLTENGKLIGTAIFCNTQVTVAGKAFNYFYTRYFASDPAIRGRGIINRYAVQLMGSIRENETAKTIFVGFINRGNTNSYKVGLSAGYTSIGINKTIGFSRFFPQRFSAVQRVTAKDDKHLVLALLKEKYLNHALVQFDYLFMHDNYYVIRENNEIVAGCQFHRAHWVINKMTGIMGKIIINVVPWIPLLNRLFNPKKFEFLVYEGLFFKPGKEHRLLEIFENLLAKEKLFSAIFWMDQKCPVCKSIKKFGKLGLMHHFVKDSDMYLMASYQNMTAEEINTVESSPFYASGYDYV